MKHKHADLMAQYAQDAMTTDTPWVLWQCLVPRSIDPSWVNCVGNPTWGSECVYRRKPKTNAQIACELLEKAHDALEVHSAIICEPNVDHIQKLVWDAMKLLSKGEQQ